MFGIIGAMQVEIEGLKKSMTEMSEEEISGVTFTKGKLSGQDVVVAVCGVGKVFAAICTEAMILHFHVDHVINIGVAGSVTDKLKVLDVAVAESVVQHDMNTTAIGDPLGLISGINKINLKADANLNKAICDTMDELNVHHEVGTLASGDLFVDSPEQREKIHERFDALAADMEGASIGQVCYVNKVPFSIIRSISDAEGSAMDFSEFCDRAAEISIKVVIGALNRA